MDAKALLRKYVEAHHRAILRGNDYRCRDLGFTPSMLAEAKVASGMQKQAKLYSGPGGAPYRNPEHVRKGIQVRYKATPEFRCPKKGEFYISGAIPVAYKATADLLQKYRIAVPVYVRRASPSEHYVEVPEGDL